MEEKKVDDKAHVEHAIETVSSSSSDSSSLNAFSPAESRKIRHRIDMRLIPICGLLYMVSLLDRTNLSNASIAGMNTELELDLRTGPDRYSIITLVFFITYILFQPPTTVLVRFFGPRYFLSTIALLWGAIMVGFGFVGNWTALVGLRIALGVFEAGLFPGVVYLLSTWYTRFDMGKRYAFFYTIGMLASAMGGILAFGLQQMDGIAGYRGWRWIFIIEGILTCLIALLGYVFLLGFPDKDPKSWLGPFLSDLEVRHVLAKVDADRGDAHPEAFSFKKWIAAGADPKIWVFATLFGSLTTVTYALAYFLPQILRRSMGFSLGLSQCLVAPPYAFAAICMVITSWASDKYRNRGIPLIANACLGLIGLPLMGFATNSGVRYFGVFLATASANSSIPLIATYQANNIRGQWKRAFCSATLVGFGGIGGIIGGTVFRAKDAPGYVPGLCVTIGANVLIIILVVALTIYFRIMNRRADRMGVLIEGEPGFRYTY